jgi:hypothetical protein
MKNLKIFDNINSYLTYRDSDELLRPSCNWYRIVNSSDPKVFDKNLPFVDNTLNYNLIKYSTIDSALAFSSLQNDVEAKLIEDVQLNDGSGNMVAVFDNYLHRPFRNINYVLDTVTTLQRKLKSIELPDTVEDIDDYAFYSFSNLQRISLGKNIRTIGEYAFSRCPLLTSLTIPGNCIESIGGYFVEQTNIESLTIESKNLANTKFENFMLYYTPRLKSVILKSKNGPDTTNGDSINYVFRGAGANQQHIDRNAFIPLQYEQTSYKNLLNEAITSEWNISHLVTDTMLQATPIHTGHITNSAQNGDIEYIPYAETRIDYSYEIGNIFCTDALTNETVSNYTLTDNYAKAITVNNTYNSKTHTATFFKHFVNATDGRYLYTIPFNYSIVQWGKPKLNLETNNSKTGWRMCATGVVNGKPHLMFRSNNANTASSACNLKITYKNTPTLTIYVRNAAEAICDYTCISKLNSPFTVSSNFYYDASLSNLYFKANTTNNSLSNYSAVHFNSTDEETTFSILFRKDISGNTGEDSSYVLIPTELYMNISDNYFHDQTRSFNTVLLNPNYNSASTPTFPSAYWTNTKIGTYGAGNQKKDAYFVNRYQLVYSLNEHGKICATDVLKGTINTTWCGSQASLVTDFLPYHIFGTSATASTKTMKSGDKIAFSTYDSKNNTYRVDTSNMYVSSNNWSTYDKVVTNVNDWYLQRTEHYWTNKQPFDISVNLTPYTTTQTGSNCFGWQQITTTKNISNSTTVTVMASIPSQFKNYGKLYCTTNSYKNATNSVSIMTVDVKNSNYLDVYHKTCGEKGYDYLVISQPNVTLAQVMNQVKTRSSTFSSAILCYNGYATNSVTNGTGTLSNFTHLRINLVQTGTHTNKIHFVYRKDSSGDKYDDTAYIFIPN